MKKTTIILAALALIALASSCKVIDDCPAYSSSESTTTEINA